jgi:hypothetical protein
MIKAKMKYVALGLVASFFMCGEALAVSQNVPIDIAFDTALSVAKDNNINFGTIADLTAGTYAINTAGAVTASAGGQVISSTNAAAGQLTVSGTTDAAARFNIVAAAYNANGGSTPSLLRCKIGAGAEASCDIASPVASTAPPGAGIVVKLGVTLTTTVAATTGDAPTVDVTVLYV